MNIIDIYIELWLSRPYQKSVHPKEAKYYTIILCLFPTYVFYYP